MHVRESRKGVDMDRSAVTLVLVPGMWFGAWCFNELIGELAERGLTACAVDLASVGDDPSQLGDFYDDAAAVRSRLDEIDGPVVLVGHSYGGAVITEAAAGPHPSVEHLVYLAADMFDAGETQLNAHTSAASVGDLLNGLGVVGDPDGAAFVAAITFHENGTATLGADPAMQFLFHDGPEDLARSAAARMRPMNLAVADQPVRAAAWHDITTTYILCTEDRTGIDNLRRMALRASRTVELPTGHCPQWSRPALLADMLADIVLRCCATSDT